MTIFHGMSIVGCEHLTVLPQNASMIRLSSAVQPWSGSKPGILACKQLQLHSEEDGSAPDLQSMNQQDCKQLQELPEQVICLCNSALSKLHLGG